MESIDSDYDEEETKSDWQRRYDASEKKEELCPLTKKPQVYWVIREPKPFAILDEAFTFFGT